MSAAPSTCRGAVEAARAASSESSRRHAASVHRPGPQVQGEEEDGVQTCRNNNKKKESGILKGKISP